MSPSSLAFTRAKPHPGPSTREFAAFLEKEDIDGVSAYRMSHSEGGYIIAVIDASNRAGEFAWAGDLYQLSEHQVEALIDRIEPFVGQAET